METEHQERTLLYYLIIEYKRQQLSMNRRFFTYSPNLIRLEMRATASYARLYRKRTPLCVDSNAWIPSAFQIREICTKV